MSNIRLFITLLLAVQTIFLVVDGWTAYVERARPRPELIRLSIFVSAMAILYYAVQLALSSAVPDFHALVDTLARALGVRPVPAGDQPPVSLMILLFGGAYLATTLFDYLVHRFLLHGWLFPLHENHHLPRIVSNLMPGIAARPFVAIPNFLINAASALVLLLVIRITGESTLIYGFEQLALPLVLLFAFIACASHSSFLRRFEQVDRLFRALAIVTPREHLVHHAADLEGNYGNFTMIWDRLFGTYVSPPVIPPATGLRYDQDFLGSLTGGLLKLPAGMREYFAVDAVCRITLDKNERDRQNVPIDYD